MNELRIEKLTLSEGDVVHVHLGEPMSAEVREVFQQSLQNVLPDGVRAFVTAGDDVTVMVEHPAEPEVTTWDRHIDAIASQLDQPLTDEARTGARVVRHDKTTTDRKDPGLSEIDPETNMQAKYLVLSDEERTRGFVRPVRREYLHEICGTVTTMGQAIAETYARDPLFYGATYCAFCREHRPVGPNGEFVWDHTEEKVGT